MLLQFKNSEGQVFLGCLGGINYCLFLYCARASLYSLSLKKSLPIWTKNDGAREIPKGILKYLNCPLFVTKDV